MPLEVDFITELRPDWGLKVLAREHPSPTITGGTVLISTLSLEKSICNLQKSYPIIGCWSLFFNRAATLDKEMLFLSLSNCQL